MAPIVVATLDGGSQQQTWENAARAAVAASRYTGDGGTIVLWTEINQAPEGKLSTLDEFVPDAADANAAVLEDGQEDQFPTWVGVDAVARTLARVCEDYHVMLHSALPREAVEGMGLGVVETADELGHLCSTFDTCGALRAAQFAGCTLDAPHRIGVEN